jgi:hypothetical protein
MACAPSDQLICMGGGGGKVGRQLSACRMWEVDIDDSELHSTTFLTLLEILGFLKKCFEHIFILWLFNYATIG